LENTSPIPLSDSDRHLLDAGRLLPVMEVFYSIQGEGYHTGKAAAFLRIGGCDVGCHWCDAKEAWNATLHPLTPLETILDQLCSFPAKSVVITGGEPLMVNLGPLCAGLKERGMQIFLETSGAYPISGMFDWICLSPKRNARPRKELCLMADELKVIVHVEEDLVWAVENACLVKDKCLLYLQPEWSRYRQVLPLIVEFVKGNPGWMVSLQSHKFMNIP
jgi:7-carboxy-7-deazaguanine synthase